MDGPVDSEARQGNADALLLHYLYILKKRKLVVVLFAVFLMATVAIATLLSTPYYAALALVEISPKAPTVLDMDDVSEFGANSVQEQRIYYATQYKILQSRSVMDRAVRMLQEEAGVTDFDEVENPAEFLRAHLLVEPVNETHLVKVGIEYPDPEKAALFANTVARAYMNTNLERARASATEALSWLQKQQKQFRAAKMASDEDVIKRRTKLGMLGLDERYNSSLERLAQMETSVTEATTDRVKVEAVFQELSRLSGDADWVPLANHLSRDNDVLGNLLGSYDALKQERTRLAARYGDKHPEMVRVSKELEGITDQIQQQIADTLSGKKAELSVLRGRELALVAQLDAVKAEVENLDNELVELKVEEAEAERNQELYSTLDRRRAEVELSQVLRANNIRVIDEARPDPTPVRPKLGMNLVVALALGLMGGCAFAFFMEYMDITVKTREDIEHIVGVPLLGVVPVVDQADLNSIGSDIDRSLFVFARPRSPTAECLRSIRTNVLFRLPSAPLRTLLITSAAPREGKSFTSSNLAAIIAMTGSRVLIIDADLRRPALHKRFGVTNERGLCNVVKGELELEDVVQHTHIPNLHVVVAGPPPPNPGELLGSDRMKEITKNFRGYDFVIIDSPPVNAVADPLVLSRMVDGVLMVVEANRTSRKLVIQASTKLAEMRANMLGAVVNKLDVRTAGYGYNYFDTYGYYYTEAEALEREVS